MSKGTFSRESYIPWSDLKFRKLKVNNQNIAQCVLCKQKLKNTAYISGFWVTVWFEPTDFQKAIKIFQAGSQWENILHFVSPNINEVLAMAKYFKISIPNNEFKNYETIKQVAEHLAERIPVVITTLGSLGVLVTRKASENHEFYNDRGQLIEGEDIQSHLYHPLSQIDKVPVDQNSVSGCGDCLAAGIIVGILNKLSEAECISLGLRAAAISLKSFDAVPHHLSTLQINERFL